ncbi:MAG: DUF3800 domain-containing protein [Acidimicrobiaceae bacterium]|nr:DUF3800 domain-containing protein [Acidimicrobiaceae bacterium]
MSPSQPTRLLFLDDSGHPAPNHASGALVIGGIAVPSARVPLLSHRIVGTKARLFPGRGPPASWELKATHIIRPNSWKRQKNRLLVQEILRTVRELDCTAYTVSIDKAKMHHSMTSTTTMPLQLRILAEHFAAECAHRAEIGLIVMDRSDHGLDTYASQSVGTYATAHELLLHPTVYYADSTSSPAIQTADLVAGIRRRAVEGDADMRRVDDDFAMQRAHAAGDIKTHSGRPWTNRIRAF